MPPMPTYQRPRGTRDLLPEEAAAMDALQAVVEARALRYGYPRISTPIIENREVFVITMQKDKSVAVCFFSANAWINLTQNVLEDPKRCDVR